MRLSVVLLIVALAGVVGGAFLIARWAVGLAVIADSAAVAWWALQRDDGQGERAPVVGEVPQTLHAVLEKARLAP